MAANVQNLTTSSPVPQAAAGNSTTTEDVLHVVTELGPDLRIVLAIVFLVVQGVLDIACKIYDVLIAKKQLRALRGIADGNTSLRYGKFWTSTDSA